MGSVPGSAPLRENIHISTYNIHGSRGTDGKKDLTRTAGIIQGADIAALQEVHARWTTNQAKELGEALALGWLYAPTVRRWCRDYRGNGLLTKLPLKHWQTHLLPNVSGYRYRVYTVAEIILEDALLSLLFTHLHTRLGREQQLKIVLDHFQNLPLPAVLVGDLNTRKEDPILKQYLPKDCIDAVGSTLQHQDSENRVDWILTRGLNIVAGGFVPPGVSDHPYYWVEVNPAV